MKRFLVISVVAVALATSTPTPFAHAASVAENGRIVFRRYYNWHHNRGAIFSIRADGAGERQITHPGRKVLDNNPDVSADGRWIVYHRTWHGRGDDPGAVFRILLDGTHVDNLTGDSCRRRDDCLADRDPSYSPGGGRIAFGRVFSSETRDFEIDLFVMRANGTHRRQITAGGPGFEDYDPSWSPDGSRLVFYRFDADRQSDAVFTVKPDGSDLRQLTAWRLHAAQGVDWSPDGRWIIFSAKPQDQSGNLRMIHPSGSGLHMVTHATKADWLKPCFSPDGTRIVAGRTLGVGADGNADIYVLRLDGSHKRDVTQTEAYDSAVDWGSRPT